MQWSLVGQESMLDVVLSFPGDVGLMQAMSQKPLSMATVATGKGETSAMQQVFAS